MKKLLLIGWFLLVFNQIEAQKRVRIEGQIINPNPSHTLYLAQDGPLLPLSLDETGRFSVDLNFTTLPAFLEFNTLNGNRIEQELPKIWFDDDQVSVTIDIQDKSYTVDTILPYQGLSETIEALKGKKQIAHILEHPNQLPSFYFAEYLKKDISINELDAFLLSTNEKFNSNYYFKRIENYINAKKRNPVTKGKTLIDFDLPEKRGGNYSVISSSNKSKLIVFMSSGCSFSLNSIELLADFNKYNKDQIEIITIWADASRDSWLNASKDLKDKINWTDLWDEYGFARTYLDNDFTPEYFLVNSEGKLIDKFRGYSKKTAKKLNALLE